MKKFDRNVVKLVIHFVTVMLVEVKELIEKHQGGEKKNDNANG